MAVALSVRTLRVQLSVHSVSECWRSELGQGTPSRYLASAGTPVHYYFDFYFFEYYYYCKQHEKLKLSACLPMVLFHAYQHAMDCFCMYHVVSLACLLACLFSFSPTVDWCI